MKYIVGILVLLVGFLFYNQYRIFRFDIAVENQYNVDEAEMNHTKAQAQFDTCQLTRYLNKKMGYKSWTNCYWPEFGKNLNDLDITYNAIGAADAKSQTMKKDKEFILRVMFNLPRKEYKTLPGPYGQTLLMCDYKGKKLVVFYSYEYGFWTEQRSIVIPEAYEVKNCKNATIDSLIKHNEEKINERAF
jgi:hypothetical protein